MVYKNLQSADLKAFKGEQAVFEGQWKNNKKHGQGKMRWVQEAVEFEGQWHEDQRVQGRLKGSNGDVYEGQFKGDIFHGKGKLIMPRRQLEFEGHFENGLYAERGVIRYERNGNVYEGEHMDFRKHGQGKLIFEDGREFEGNFMYDQINGEGEMGYPNGDFYKGHMLREDRHGEGLMLYGESKKVYEGEWRNNKQHGTGKLSKPDGSYKIGIWRQGVLVEVKERSGGQNEANKVRSQYGWATGQKKRKLMDQLLREL